MIGYVILLVITILYLITALILLFKHKFTLSRMQYVALGLSILAMYVFPVFEVITTLSLKNQSGPMVLPTYNIIPLILIISSISCFTTGKVQKTLLSFVGLCIIPLAFGLFKYEIYCINYFRNFYEKYALYSLSQLLTLVYAIYILINEKDAFNIKNLLISIGIMAFIYGFMNIHNVIYNTTFFGLTTDSNAYIIDRLHFNNSTLTLIFNYIFLFSAMLLTYLIKKIIKKEIM